MKRALIFVLSCKLKTAASFLALVGKLWIAVSAFYNAN
jgi:hypothetical protein